MRSKQKLIGESGYNLSLIDPRRIDYRRAVEYTSLQFVTSSAVVMRYYGHRVAGLKEATQAITRLLSK